MQRYSDYNDSGVEWLGEIPVHWDAGHAKRWFRIVNGGTPQSSVGEYWDGEVVWLTPEDLGQNQGHRIEGGRRMITVAGLQSCSASLCPKGSLVVSTRAPIGHLAITATNAATNQGCRTLVPGPQIDSTFGYYAVESARQVLESLGQGSTFMELTPTSLGSLPLPLPPLNEQRDIAAFLDRETERIDSLIAKKRLLIERMQEYRTALITRTVTRGLPPEAARAAGLDPSPRFKPSGVEWLGDVPEHWDVGQLKRWFRIVNGGTPKGGEDRFWDGEIIWLTPDDLGRNQATYISEGNRKLTTEGLDSCSARLCPEGSIALSTRAPIGHVAITSNPSATNQGCRTLVPTAEIDSEFAYFVILAGRSILESLGQGSTFMELGQGDLSRVRMAKPPLWEQRALVRFLNRETERVTNLTSHTQAAIQRLQEYRTALITAAVTGKIDVRDAASSDRDSAESQP